MQSFSFFSYFYNASLVVKVVMLILFALSVISWTLIFQYNKNLLKTKREIEKFRSSFSSISDLYALYSNNYQQYRKDINLLNLFIAGFKEYVYFLNKNDFSNHSHIVDNIKRAMRVEQSNEMGSIEGNVGFLATIGSTSPYIGLFGTVWGIMTSFQALSGVEHATISLVAPGISEALFATALALIAAIPAVMAYNRFVGMLSQIESQYESFQDEFINKILKYKVDE